MKKCLVLLIGLVSLPVLAADKIYECHQGGTTVYSNKQKSGCQPATLGTVGSYSVNHKLFSSYDSPIYSSSSSGGSRGSGSSKRTGTADQMVQPAVQAQRDSGRLSILQRELENEKQALDSAQKDLASSKAAKKDAASLAALEGAIKDRQENINALQKEISRM